MCSWSNTQNVKVDKLDWERTSREAESHYPTPPEDHSLGTERGALTLDDVLNASNVEACSTVEKPDKKVAITAVAIKAYI